MSADNAEPPQTGVTGATGTPLIVGVWLVLPAGLHWRGEGIGRTIEWIIEGFKDAGLLGRHVIFRIAVSSWIRADIERSFETLLGSLEGVEFITFTTRRYRAVHLVDRIFSLNGYFRFAEFWNEVPPDLAKLTGSYGSQMGGGAEAQTRSRIRRLNRKALGGISALGIEPLRDRIVRDLGVPLPPDRVLLRNVLDPQDRARWSAYRKELGAYKKKYWKIISSKLMEEAAERPQLPGVKIFNQIIRTGRRIPVLKQVLGLTMRIANAFVQTGEQRDIMEFARRIDERTHVDIWWVASPALGGAEYLRKPVVANFWDFVIGEFGFLWDEPSLREIYGRVKIIMHKATAVLTQSHHNVGNKLERGFLVDPRKATVCYLTVPRTYRQHVRTFDREGVRSEASRQEAEGIVHDFLKRRAYLNMDERIETWRERGLELERLQTFPFATATYAICSTQARPYKNLDFLVDTFLWMIEKRGVDAYLILTSKFDISNPKDPIGKLIWKRRLIDRVYSLHRVPNRVHAALYHNAACTLHPSFTEGGVGSYPFLEGMVMGTPGLVADGEYSREGLRLHPDYPELLMSSTNRRKAAARIEWVLHNREAAYQRQLPVFEAHDRWKWSDVAMVYAQEMYRAAGRTAPATVADELGPDWKRRYHATHDQR